MSAPVSLNHKILCVVIMIDVVDALLFLLGL